MYSLSHIAEKIHRFLFESLSPVWARLLEMVIVGL